MSGGVQGIGAGRVGRTGYRWVGLESVAGRDRRQPAIVIGAGYRD